MEFFKYEDRLVRVTDNQGYTFTGIAESFPSGYGLHEYGREEASLKIGDCMLFEGDIEKVEFLPTYEEARAAVRPGRYRHFKGREYEVIGVARHSETEESMVVYRALYGDGGMWVRPADMWMETVERDGRRMPRFERIPD